MSITPRDLHVLTAYYLDVEYNRHGDRKKTVLNAKAGEPVSIVCDLLLRSRGELEDENLIAVEMKKADAADEHKRAGPREASVLDDRVR
jgi:hypothetical protein